MGDVTILGTLLPLICAMNQYIEPCKVLVTANERGNLILEKQSHLMHGFGELIQETVTLFAVCFEG